MCGQLIGHYPVGRWLRVACRYIKRTAGTDAWDDPVPEWTAKLLREILQRVGEGDPVGGGWIVRCGTEGKVWCDASSLAIGVCLEIDGDVVEDASWLRKCDDGAHINVAELDAVLRGSTWQ